MKHGPPRRGFPPDDRQENAMDNLPPPVGRRSERRSRCFLAGDGRCLRRDKGRWSEAESRVNTFVSQRQAGQVVPKNGWQVFVGGFFGQNKTVASRVAHISLAIKRPVKRLENDGFLSRAGDGTRTRDSLLGRQEPTRISLAWYRLALQAPSRFGKVFCACLRQDFICISGRLLRLLYLEYILFVRRWQGSFSGNCFL